jgi:hypothetical protein
MRRPVVATCLVGQVVVGRRGAGEGLDDQAPGGEQEHGGEVEQAAEPAEQELEQDGGVGGVDAVADAHALGELGEVDVVVAGLERVAEGGEVVGGEHEGAREAADDQPGGEPRAAAGGGEEREQDDGDGGGVLADDGEAEARAGRERGGAEAGCPFGQEGDRQAEQQQVGARLVAVEGGAVDEGRGREAVGRGEQGGPRARGSWRRASR